MVWPSRWFDNGDGSRTLRSGPIQADELVSNENKQKEKKMVDIGPLNLNQPMGDTLLIDLSKEQQFMDELTSLLKKHKVKFKSDRIYGTQIVFTNSVSNKEKMYSLHINEDTNTLSISVATQIKGREITVNSPSEIKTGPYR